LPISPDALEEERERLGRWGDREMGKGVILNFEF
jgi:hypothetical protein